MILAFILECISLVLYTMFGMALMPKTLVNDKENILIAPLIGVSVWQAFCLFLGFFFPYNKIFLLVLLFIVAGIIIYKKNKLYIPKNYNIFAFIIIVILSSLIILYGVLPKEIGLDGGVYFTPSAFDHQRTAMINSITNLGIPPLNPYLAVEGISPPLYYHFGLLVIAAQYSILFGVAGFCAGATMTAFVFTINLLTMGYITYKLTQKKMSLLFLILISFTGYLYPVMTLIFPQSLFPQTFVGFWSNIDDVLWTPHNIYAGTNVVLFCWLYAIGLKCEEKREVLHIFGLLAMMATSAVTSSIYAGGCALILFAFAVLIEILYNKSSRVSFNKIFVYQLLCGVIAVLFCLKYILFVSKSSSSFPLEFGTFPTYEIKCIFDALKSMANLYMIVLPSNIGIIIPLGVIALFVKNIISNKFFFRLIRIYILSTFISIFFIHDSGNMGENNFGWRTITPIKFYLVIFSSILICKLYEYLKTNKKIKSQYVLIVLMLFLPVIFSHDLKEQLTFFDSGTDEHIVLAKAKKGWDVIRKNTKYSDLVVCNPDGFPEISKGYFSTVNFLFGFYADRMNVIADNYYTKTSANGTISNQDVEILYSRVVKFFSGNPDKNEVDYMADKLKVKALLVTSKDGLWNNPGALETRYPKKIEGDHFRAYFTENTMN